MDLRGARSGRLVAFTLSACLGLVSCDGAFGALIFRQVGNDLVIENDEVISWQPRAMNVLPVLIWGLAFETAYTAPNPTQVFVRPEDNTLRLSLGGRQTGEVRNFGVRSTSTNSFSNQGFLMSFLADPLPSLDDISVPGSVPGLFMDDTVELSTGSAVLRDWFALGGLLPDDLGTSSVFLFDTGGGQSPFGDPGAVFITIPEPASWIALTFVLARWGLSRRR